MASHARVQYGTSFFFQAEDGIRDDLVTGVQTCALPISPGKKPNTRVYVTGHHGVHNFDLTRVFGFFPGAIPQNLDAQVTLRIAHSGVRSEERRVGKECRSRWSPYH